jgi:nicotinate phosphoribosyltransferase
VPAASNRPAEGAGSAITDSGLLTDHYELTMLKAALQSGVAHHRAVFEVFARSLPDRRRYGVLAGIGRLAELLAAFRFDRDALEFLTAARVLDEATCEWLAGYRFHGSMDCYAEGETFFPGSPVLVVDGTFGEALLLETLVLSALNHDSAVATAAARMVCAAGDRPLIEMGSRRTHEVAAVAAARAAYVAGFASTSNLRAGHDYGLPTTGTSAHAFTLVHRDERQAFRAQVDALGPDTTLLVDTYDVDAGIRAAVEAAGPHLGAIRLDSGDLVVLAHRARRQLDELGATGTRIVVTGDLDEHAIARLASAPVDAYGVGTAVVTGSGAPTAGFVYKLVARALEPGPDAPLVPVAKKSVGKASIGGRKWSLRRRGPDGCAISEVVYVTAGPPPEPRADERALQVALMREGELIPPAPLAAARAHCAAARDELPVRALSLSAGEPAIDVVFEEVTR